MKHVLVIADDFTGAAEIAGVGHRFGLPARVVRRPVARVEPGLTVVDTDSRLLTPDAAAGAVSRFVEPLRDGPFDLVFKKTDSVLRGPVAAELDALAAALGRAAVVLVPQNPSRRRVIVGGEYRIDGIPLHETPFANDPTHPARSSDVAELLGPHEASISIGDGASALDLRHWASRLRSDTLPAGGADFFTAILEHGGLTPSGASVERSRGPRLFVCGSTRPHPSLEGVAVRPMVDSTDDWLDVVVSVLAGGRDVMMTIDRPLDLTPGAAARIEQRVAIVAAAVLRRAGVGTVFATGGATAAAVCRTMRWDDFDVEGEIAPGIVRLRPRDALRTPLIVKPGSYPWPPQLAAT